MKKAFRYTARPLSPLVLLSFLCALASFGFRVWTAGFRTAAFSAKEVLFSFSAPLLAACIFALCMFRVWRKQVVTQRTIFPYTLFALHIIIQFAYLPTLWMSLCGIGITLTCWFLYFKTLRGRIAFQKGLVAIHGIFFALQLVQVFLHRNSMAGLVEAISVCSFYGAVLFHLLALQKEELPTRFRRRGDRPDGRLIRTRPPMDNVGAYIMVSKIGASNQFRDEFEIAKAEKYILQKRKEGLKGFGLMHVLVAAYVRTVAEKPAINRFIAGQKVYARDDVIEVNLTIKKEMTESAPETVVKFNLNPRMTPTDVYYVIQKEVLDNKTDSLDSGMDNLAALLNYIPGLFLKFTVWFLKLLDYFGLLPGAVTKVSPFHGSMFMTSMGSLGIPPVQHHLYDFGNLPVFIAFGPKRKKYILQSDGSVKEKRYCEFTATLDDRICDGYYYAAAFKTLSRYVSNPYLLDTPPEEVKYDIE